MIEPDAARGARPAPNARRLLFEDDFDGPVLDTGKWLPFYLPRWSGRESSRASHDVRDGVLRLYVAEDQRPWCPEFDGDARVSNLQTGHFSGELGSRVGQHRFREGLIVREAIPPARLFLPCRCRLCPRLASRPTTPCN